MSDEDDNGADEHRIYASVGSLELTVKGQDAEWVSETWDEKLETLLEESEGMAQAVRDGERCIQ